jgi:hypothetical protein
MEEGLAEDRGGGMAASSSRLAPVEVTRTTTSTASRAAATGLPTAAAPPTATSTKVAVGAGSVLAAGVLGIGILALVKGWAFGKAAEYVWQKTGGAVFK